MESFESPNSSPSASSKRRRWMQFSLRTLFIVMTLVGLWLGRTAYVVQKREAAFTAIGQAGGKMTTDVQAPKRFSAIGRWWRRAWGDAYVQQVASINLRELPVGDEIMPHVGALPEISSELDLIRTRVTDDGLRDIRHLHNLQYLFLNETSVTDAGVKHICRLRQLRHLNLGGTKITDAAAFDLVKLPQVEELLLTAPGITDATVQRLAPLEDLTCLYLNGTQVTDEGVAHLRSFAKLDEIGLYMTDVTDKGVEHLARMPSLRRINLNKTRITDVSLDLLQRLPNLEHLEVSSTIVSDEAIARFKAANPGCTVEAYGRRRKVAD